MKNFILVVALLASLPLLAQYPTTTNYGNYTGCSGPIEQLFFDFTQTSSTVITQSGINIQNTDNECCGEPANAGCLFFNVYVDPGATGVNFSQTGAGGNIDIYYDNCGQVFPANTPIFLDPALAFIDPVTGQAYHRFMFCRSGQTTYGFTFTQIIPTFPPDLGVTEGCTIPLSVTGLNPATVVWTSTSPGTPGQWNNLLTGGAVPGVSGVPYGPSAAPYNGNLGATGTLNVVVTPTTNSPSSVTYQVCGALEGACNNSTYCDNVNITIYPDLFADAGLDVAICAGAAPGTTVPSTATAIGGTPPFTFNWQGVSGAAAGFNFTSVSTDATEIVNLSLAGTYTLTITDANNCATATDQVVLFNYNTSIQSFITSPSVTVCATPIPTINLQGYVTQTNQGIWTASVPGTFSNANVTSGVAPGTASTFTPAAGTTGTVTFTLTPTNNLGCPITPASFSVNLTQFTSTLAAVPTNITCNGLTNGSINLTVTPGAPPYSTSAYSWSNGATIEDITGLGVNTYTVTVTDVNGCTGTTSAAITQPTVLTGAITAQTNVSCFGGNNGSVTVAGSGATPGYTYSLNGGAAQVSGTFSGLVAGAYTITITDTRGCTRDIPVTITQPLAPLTLTSTPTNVLCNGASTGAIDITPSGGTPGYTYTWTTVGGSGLTAGSQDQSGLTAGQYTVVVTDANYGLSAQAGCTTTSTFTITQPLAPLTLTSTPTNVLCNGASTGAIDITPSGGTPGYTYTWTTVGGSGLTAGSQDQSGLTAGQYTVVVTDANYGLSAQAGCTTTSTFTITQPLAPLTLTSTPTNVLCNGASTGAIDITPSGGTPGYTYTWTTVGGSGLTAGAQDQSGLTAGQYTVVVTDANYGLSAQAGCTATTTITITEPTDVTVSSAVTTNYTGFGVSCIGLSDGGLSSTPGGGAGGYTYSWNTVPSTGVVSTIQDPTGLPAGTYQVTVTDANGCTEVSTVTITEPTDIVINPLVPSVYAGGFNLSGCNPDGSIDMTLTGGTGVYTYTWNPGNFTTQDISNLAAGTYTVVATDQNGCTETATITLTQPNQLITTISSPTYPSGTNISCFGFNDGSIDLGVSGGTPLAGGGYTYSWTGPNGFTSGVQDPGSLIAGVYNVTITDANGCQVTTTITLTEP
ncbi:MAG: beta strand repeat-containing protein, partial [Bacteroidota bacterium]